MSQDCIFCSIAAKEISAKILYEDEDIVVFPDINPVAPVHVLVIPKKHIANLTEIGAGDEKLLGRIFATLPKIAGLLGVVEDGFRVVVNTKEQGGQTVNHLHWHILGGRFMTWPPG
jgi:histidine triad (HIT) family protein